MEIGVIEGWDKDREEIEDWDKEIEDWDKEIEGWDKIIAGR